MHTLAQPGVLSRLAFPGLVQAAFASLFLGPVSAGPAQGGQLPGGCGNTVQSVSIGCTPTAPCLPTGGGTTCAVATVTYKNNVPPRGRASGTQQSFPTISIPKFNQSLGVLRQVGIKATVQPGGMLYVAETTQSECGLPNESFQTYGSILNVFEVTAPEEMSPFLNLTPLLPSGLSSTQLNAACLPWGVVGLASSLLPATDGCENYGFPPGFDLNAVLNPSFTNIQISGYTSVCAPPLSVMDMFSDQAGSGLNCPLQGVTPVEPNSPLCVELRGTYAGKRYRAGQIAGLIGVPGNEAGLADVRVFDATDAYVCRQCYTDPTILSRYVLACESSEPPCVDFTTQAVALFKDVGSSSTACSGLDSRRDITVGLTIEVTYEYCPYPPLAVDDCADACRVQNSDTFINVLDNDSASNAPQPPGCAPVTLQCDLLTGTVGIIQGTYGTATWVADGNCPIDADSLCLSPRRCIRYRLNTLPPANCVYDTFTYTITNSSGCTDTATVRVLIGNPDAMDDGPYEICNEPNVATVTIPVLCNDIVCGPVDAFCPGRTLDCSFFTGSNGISGVGIPTAPPGGTPFATATWVDCAQCAVPGSGPCAQNRCIRYVLTGSPPDGVRFDQFTYTIRDSRGCLDTATVRVNIASPRPMDDEAIVCATIGQKVKINVLCNDASNRPLRCELLQGTSGVSNPTYGIARWFSGNDCGVNALCTDRYRCIEYEVDTNLPTNVNTFVDTFTYTLIDDLDCRRTATVRVTLCRVDAVDDTAMGCEGEPVQVCILANDVAGCATISCANVEIVSITPPSAGTASTSNSCAALPNACMGMIGGCTTCCLQFVPAAGFAGPVTVRYRVRVTGADLPGTVCESEAFDCFDEADVNICVKPRPVAVEDCLQIDNPSFAGPYFVDVLANDTGGAGCELCCSPGPCVIQGCPTILQQGTSTVSTVLPGPDCRIQVTLLPNFTGMDVIRYKIQNNCGCCAEGRLLVKVCITYDRQQPGSLVIYPEYDNRDSQITLLTLTNTNCVLTDPGIRVEVLYIDKEDCSETNHDFVLTPCDTVTWFTKTLNPNSERGYVYVFAKNNIGQAISFNYLIGHQFQANGFGASDYSVNPWVFRSSLPDRQPTDLDFDDIRDLDGVEYDRPPGELLIPRFLGQDAVENPTHRSDLVLLNLSGGQAFTTTVQLFIYNDSEDLFEDQHTFYCWDRVPLLTLSGAFDNVFLAGTMDDEDEILGAETREAGWFRIRGLLASSGIETIVGPSILAHLIEIASGMDVADLPFELCPAGNGDLLPTGPFGDGPDFVPGDNE